MKKIIALGLLCLIVYAGIGPFLTLNGIKSSLKEGDSESLSEYVDFPSLRQNLKDQLNAKMASELVEDDDNPFAFAAIGFATVIVDGVLDAVVTPSGIANLLSGESIDAGQGAKETDFSSVLENASYGFKSHDRFFAKIKGDSGDTIEAMLKRDGLQWRLNNLILPLE